MEDFETPTKKDWLKLVVLIVVMFVVLAFVPFAHAETKDYEGADKWQHFGLGAASAGLCRSVIDSSPRCFFISTLAEAAHQAYAIRTNPNKRAREGGYDLLAHMAGEFVGLPAGKYVYSLTHDPVQRMTVVRYAWSF